MDLDALKTLCEIVDQGSFAKAAKSRHKAQSAISYQIRKLEDHFGLAIFDRSEYRAELTPAGRALVEEGRRLLKQSQRVETLAARFTQGWEPRLELVIDGSLPVKPVMKALKVLSSEGVPTRIQVKTEFLGGVQKVFEQNQSDMMLVKDYQPSPGLKATALPDVTFILVATAAHPLAGMGAVQLDDLYEHVELTIHDSSDPDKTTLDSLQFGGDRVFYLSDFGSKKQALMMGLGYGWMPDFLVADELKAGELVQLAYEGATQHRFTPQFIYRSDRPLGRAGRMLEELLLREFGQPLAP